MKEKFLYLFGAGASANALPIVKDSADGTVTGLAKAFKGLAVYLKNENPQHGFSPKLVKQMNENLLWLQTESDKHQTIDTYAKYLYLMNQHSELKRLKLTLSFYLTIEQLHRNKLDSRYLIWLISILDQAIFPENIKILTWNYDFQLQLAATNFRKESLTVHKGGGYQHSPPLVDYYPPVGNIFPHTTQDYDAMKFNMVHLNGIAGFFKEGNNGHFDNAFLKHSEVKTLLNKIIEQPESFIHLLSFAWEKGTDESTEIFRRVEFAKALASDTTILVVIGYSFPFFNRVVDKQIFDILKQSGKLKTIYFQDPYLDGTFLHNQFGLDPKQVIIKHTKKTETFYIPAEL
ncbi:MAG: hypothetical protein Q8M15_07485 [Bacteroidota bacterium]|nr:hypothetical protein [Bacteroidota bacterium]